jgi:hypothetical protein
LKLYGVDLYANDEAWVRDSSAYFVNDLEYEACSVLEGASVLIGAFVGGLAEKLGQKVAIGAVDLQMVSRICPGCLALDEPLKSSRVERYHAKSGISIEV